jgi:hypothetical protein
MLTMCLFFNCLGHFITVETLNSKDAASRLALKAFLSNSFPNFETVIAEPF